MLSGDKAMKLLNDRASFFVENWRIAKLMERVDLTTDRSCRASLARLYTRFGSEDWAGDSEQ